LTNKPIYNWNAVFDSTWYYLWVSRVNVNGSLTTVHTKWYTSAEACAAGTCSITPDVALNAGNYRWWIQTWNEAGYGPWSNSMDFTPTVPAAAILVSPSNSIGANYTPTYTWNKVDSATWFYLWVDGTSGNAIKKWYTSADAGCASTSTCSVPSPTSLVGGNYTWWIQTWSDVGYGPWSAAKTFNTTIAPAPVAASLVSPNGATTNTTPTYTWNKVNAATWYYLWVSSVNSDGLLTAVHTKWYDSTLVCSGAICSITPAGVTLAGGPYKWWIQTYSDSGGYGPWSAEMAFSLPIPWPRQPTLISPSGTITNRTPTYSWNAVSSETGVPASWYQLSVNGPSGSVISQWYIATNAACSSGTGTCSITPSMLLNAGKTYTWQVRGYNVAGNGAWSNLMSFTVASNCSPAYPGVCIPPPPPDLNCGDISYTNFTVLAPDPHNFDGDHDGIGCETP
jgi:hypothetical protein